MAIEYGVILKTLLSPLIWVAILFLLALVSIGGLYIRKVRKLVYPTLIFTNVGNGKMGIEKTKAGWYKSRTIFWGLWETGGERELKIKDGRKVFGGSSIDFHDIDGKRGLVLQRKEDDPKILLPLTKMQLTNREILATIASADFRDAAVQIIDQATKETRNRTSEIVQWVLFGGVIIFALIAIIMIVQMVRNGQKEAAELILKAGETCSAYARVSVAP